MQQMEMLLVILFYQGRNLMLSKLLCLAAPSHVHPITEDDGKLPESVMPAFSSEVFHWNSSKHCFKCISLFDTNPVLVPIFLPMLIVIFLYFLF